MNEPIHVRIHKAGSTDGRHAPDLLIEATEEFPQNFPNETYVADAQKLHDQNADVFTKAMITCLPGGTIDRILGGLLKHRLSTKRVNDRD